MSIRQLSNWLRGKSTPRKTRRDDTPRLRAELLEDRIAPATFTVTWDGTPTALGGAAEPVGAMTLQQAIAGANATAGTNNIIYGKNFSDPTINVTQSFVLSTADAKISNGPLPQIVNHTLIIDGTTKAGAGTTANIFLESTKAGNNVSGFDISGAATANSILRNLNISDAQFTIPNPTPPPPVIVVFPGAPNDFSASNSPTEFGIRIQSGTSGVAVQNVIVTGIDGDAVIISDSANNTVGGSGTNQGVLLTANNGNGVHISGAASTNNIIETGIGAGTTITSTGQAAGITNNAADGILIDTGAGNNVLGGFTAAPVNSGNDIGGNAVSGIHLNNSSGNRIQRNWIGLNSTGTASFANGLQGILIENSSKNNLIGGNDVPNANKIVAGNFIAGNTGNGISIIGTVGFASTGNQIFGNLIGISSPTGGAPVGIPNTGDGILVQGQAQNTLIGSTTTASNFIGANNRNGIEIVGSGTSGTVVVNNRLGISSSTGNLALTSLDTKLGNVQDGVLISGGATNITVGGGGTNAQNIIGDNRNGINVQGSSNVVLKGNWLGVNKKSDNTYPNLGNLQDGILVQSSSSITVGGAQSLEGNRIGTNGNGVHLILSNNVQIQGNSIGPNFTGTPINFFPLPPSLEQFQPVFQSVDGILIEGSTNVGVGTATGNGIQNAGSPNQTFFGGGNLISHNRHGINIRGYTDPNTLAVTPSSGVTVVNNFVGTEADPTTTTDLANQDDGIVVDGSNNITIGGTAPLTANQIADNLDGVQISGGSFNVTVQGNTIRNNNQSGVRISASTNNLIGGDTAAAANLIFNRRLTNPNNPAAFDNTFNLDGVLIELGSSGNKVQGNLIGTDGTAATNVGNKQNGITINGSANNLIGGDVVADPGLGNTIWNNSFNGVAVVESVAGANDANGNTIEGNSILQNLRLGIDLGDSAGTVRLNDKLDPDGGANRTQNFPVISSAQSAAGSGTIIDGTLNSRPGHTFRIEIFHIATPNATGSLPNYGQAKDFVGTVNVTTDATTGDGAWTFVNANIVLPAAEYVTATATDITTGDTSEFGLDQTITGAPGPNTYVVDNDGNIFPTEGADLLIPPNGAMTLAQAITLANQHPGADRIVFAEHPQYTISGATIKYYQESRNLFTNGNLPDITDTVIIDGAWTAWPQVQGGTKRFAQNYGIVFNKASHGLVVSDNPTAQSLFSNPNATAANVVLRHINVTGFGVSGVGVALDTKFGGTNLQDMNISGFGSDGVQILNSPNNIVGGSGASQSVNINAVSGSGVNIIGSKATGNLVQQTTVGGTFGAGGNGIWIQGANNNTIGGNTASSAVLVKGSGANGIYLIGSSGTRVQRSTVGDVTDIAPNHFDGIRIEDSPLTTIGGATAAEGNNISGNTEQGIDILGSLSAGALIESNTIGSPTAPNSGNGIFVNNVANVSIGNTVTAANVITGNNLDGIYILGANAAGARVINTSVNNNLTDGIVIENTSNVIIGGSTNSAGGSVNQNRRGISVLNSKTVTIQQMNIGNNGEEGIRIDGSTGIAIGGTASAIAGNTITGNRDGVSTMNGSGSVTLQNNTISNQSQDGVIINNTGTVVIGTPGQFGNNSISRNRNGIRVLNGSTNFSVKNNSITNNSDDGIRIDGTFGAIIGGTESLARNTITGNRNGVHLATGSGTATIYQNVISQSQESGILLDGSSNNTIGGETAFGLQGAQGNVIFSNALNGIYIKPDLTNPLSPIFSNNNRIIGNFIGVNTTGTGTFGNQNAGVYIDGGSNNMIGGTVHDTANKLEDGNVIANSGSSGVVVVTDNGPAVGNSIEGNRIFNSGKLAIDLGGNLGQVTFNDLKDVDTGANNLQNFPTIVLASSTAATGTRIQGTLNSTPNRTFRVELYYDTIANPTGTPASYGQGENYIGFVLVSTDSNGDGTFSYVNASLVIPSADVVSATATDTVTGDTSEFALTHPIDGTAPGPATYTVNNDGNHFPLDGADLLIPGNGPMTLAQAITLANQHPGSDRIVFALNPEYTISTNGTIKYLQEDRTLFTNGDLPDITDTVVIDGSPFAGPQTQGGNVNFTSNYNVIFNGNTHGFVVSDNPTLQSAASNPTATATNVIFRHMHVFGGNGIGFDLTSKFGGVNIQDTTIQNFGSDGVRIFNSPNNIVGGSGASQSVVIDNVSGTGVNIVGSGSTGNLVQQVGIGTTFGVGGNGIWVQQANNNTIGGFVAGSGVTIRGTGANGIYLLQSSGTRIQRSTIGDLADQFANHLDGVRVEDSANTLVGGVNAAAGNNIAGNTGFGIHFLGALSAGSQVQSDTIGNPSAPNTAGGIFVDNVPNVAIGSTVSASNTVDGNNNNGIYILGPNSTGVTIINTSVGKNGGNLVDGIVIENDSNVTIGGATSNAGGTVQGNRRGISILNSKNINVQQMTVIGNSEEGIRMEGSSGILIGGTGSALAANKITNNRDGIRAESSSGISLLGNTILNQSQDGVIIDNATGSVVVGSPAQFGGNLIGGNRNGVRAVGGTASFTIQNNIIGTGTGGPGNLDDGIRIDGINGAIIGGNQPLSSNFVSGNRNGLHLTSGSSGAVVLGNVFGNSTENGVLLEGSSNNTIGGKTAAEVNTISSNALNGVYLKPDFTNPLAPIFSNGNVIKGNFIGVDQTGNGNFRNGSEGIYIDGGSNNTIGGTVHDVANKLEEGNIIANSGQNGISIVTDNGPATGNAMLGNRIFANGLLGIDLNGVTGLVNLNDAMDPDGGANNTQNFPVITAAKSGSIATILSGTLNSAPNRTYRVEFFGTPTANTTGNPPGYGQGQTFIGAMNVTTDFFGNASFTFQSLIPFAVGTFVTGTATDLTTNDTSEFGLSLQAQIAAGMISGQKFNDLNGNGIKDAGEPGLQGWEIDLDYNNDGTIDAKATTDASGNYSFTKLTDGIYKLAEVIPVGSGWIQTAAPGLVQITGEATVPNQDFGNFKLAQISGHKFNDLNNNGKQDPGEGPLQNVVINLYQVSKGTQTLIATKLTDLSGNYAFTNLGPNFAPISGVGPITLRVREVSPPNYIQTTINPADFVLVSGTNVTGLDFGNHGTGPIIAPAPGDAIIVLSTDAGIEGQVRVLNSKNQQQMFSFVPFPGFTGGVRVTKGDVNGDGIADIIVAAGPGGGPAVKVYDGLTGNTIRAFFAYDTTFTGGVFVSTSDVNHDGFADIVAGAGQNGGPHVKVFDGKTNIELFSFFAYQPTFTGGVTVAGGDVNGDGFGDIVVGAGKYGGPHVQVFSGATFGQPVQPTLLRSFMAFNPAFNGGIFVSTAHLNSDNDAEIIVAPNNGGGPEVRVFDGATTAILKDFLGFGNGAGSTPPSLFTGDSQFFGGVRVGSADVNGDGISDIVIGAGPIQSSRLVVYSGAGAGLAASKLLDINPVFDPSFMGGIFVD